MVEKEAHLFMTEKLPFEISDKPLSGNDLAVITKGFDADTAAQGAPPHKLHELTILQRDDSGVVIAAMNGRTWWDWLYIDILWVMPSYQKQGFATKLVKRAEAEALKRGCKNAYLWTESFQAPNFYPRLGYQQFVVMPDFPIGHKRMGFMKRLAA